MAEVKATTPGATTTNTSSLNSYIQSLRDQITAAQNNVASAKKNGSSSSGALGGLGIQNNDAAYYQKQVDNLQGTLNSVLQNQSQGLDADGKPLDQTFNSLIDPTTGLLSSQYVVNAGDDIKVDSAAANKIREMALATGPSDWAQSAYAKQALGQEDALNSSRSQSAGAQAQTLNALMMQGGLSGGSRERIGSQTLKDQLMAAQTVNRQGQLDRATIDTQDQTNKNQYLTQAAGFDYNDAGIAQQNRSTNIAAQQANINAALTEVNAQRSFDQNQYNQKMQAWAANKQADAQAKAGGGGK